MNNLRKMALEARRSMSDDERAHASRTISDRVIRSSEFLAAKAIACYLPMDDEVDPGRVIARAWCMGKSVFCPVTLSDGEMVFRKLLPDTLLQKNRFSIWEPIGSPQISARALDLVVAPLVAFDHQRNRIGMGGGYYDRAFAHLRHRKHWLRPKLVGVAFDRQKVEKIRPNPWDIALYRIVSESD